MSEFNDFERRPEAGTFRSCIDAIATCNFYILFVGARRGSWYDGTLGVSVTQQEFRIAADLHDAGKITVIPFLRSEVVTALRERRAVQRAINESGVEQALPSAYFDDPVFMERFIDEVTSRMIGKPGPQSVSELLWHYSFSDFSHVVDTLRVMLNLHYPVSRQAVLANLRWEILDNLGELAHNTQYGPAFVHSYLRDLRQEISLDASTLQNESQLDHKYASKLTMFILQVPRQGQIRKSAVEAALFSGEFLRYDAASKMTDFTDTYGVLQRLLHEIERLETSLTFFEERRVHLLTDISAWNESVKILGSRTLRFKNSDLLMLFNFQDRLQSIHDLSLTLYYVATGFIDEAPMPPLPPTSPLLEEVEKIEDQRLSREQAEEWIRRQMDEAMKKVQEMLVSANRDSDKRSGPRDDPKRR